MRIYVKVMFIKFQTLYYTSTKFRHIIF